MKETVILKKGIKIDHIWFSKEDEKPTKKADIYFYHGIERSTLINNSLIISQNTAITDISNNIEEIYNNISKNFKYEIRRGKKENLEVKVYKKIDQALLNKFANCYNQMFHAKGMKVKLNKALVKKYFDDGYAYMTIVYFENKEMAFHVYLIEKDRSRFLYSCSECRNVDVDKSLIGRANKYLHMYDYYLLKNEGVTQYDWGGIMDFSNPSGIDKLKLNLAGNYQKKVYFNQMIGISFFGKVIIKILKHFNKNY